MLWYAIHTKPRQEKRAVENLSAWGVETFVPWLLDYGWPSFPRPLFPSYIFACFDAVNMLHDIQFTRGVLSVVSFGGRPVPIVDAVIAEIRSRVSHREEIVRKRRALKPGTAVVIESGPLRGLKAIFEQDLAEGERVRILLEVVAYSAHVELSRSEVTELAVGGAA